MKLLKTSYCLCLRDVKMYLSTKIFHPKISLYLEYMKIFRNWNCWNVSVHDMLNSNCSLRRNHAGTSCSHSNNSILIIICLFQRRPANLLYVTVKHMSDMLAQYTSICMCTSNVLYRYMYACIYSCHVFLSAFCLLTENANTCVTPFVCTCLCDCVDSIGLSKCH